jgi:hypothetical protein
LKKVQDVLHNPERSGSQIRNAWKVRYLGGVARFSGGRSRTAGAGTSGLGGTVQNKDAGLSLMGLCEVSPASHDPGHRRSPNSRQSVCMGQSCAECSFAQLSGQWVTPLRSRTRKYTAIRAAESIGLGSMSGQSHEGKQPAHLEKTGVTRWVGSLAGIMNGSKGPSFSRRRESRQGSEGHRCKDWIPACAGMTTKRHSTQNRQANSAPHLFQAMALGSRSAGGERPVGHSSWFPETSGESISQ